MAALFETEDLPYGVGPNTLVAPRAAMQGAVFSSLIFKGRTVRPVYVKPEVVAEYGHVRVLQTAGEQLDQGDADVYLELARMAFEQLDPESKLVEVKVNADALLKRLSRVRGTESRKWLASCISRLKRASFLFEVPGLREWETSFLWDFERNLETVVASDYVIQMNPKLIKVYAAGKTLINASQRQALGHDTLAKALHSFFSSHDRHKESFVSVDTLQALTGRGSMRPDRFLKGLKESIENLKQATGWFSIKLEKNVLKVQQVETKKKAPAQKPAATKPQPTPVQTAPAAAKPAGADVTWDDITCADDLERLETLQLIRLFDDQARKLYDATKPKDALDYPGKRAAALAALDDLLYIKLDERAYKQNKAEEEDYADI